MKPPENRNKISKGLLAALVVFLGCMVFAIAFVSRVTFLSDLDNTARERLLLYQGTLLSALEKFQYLPYFLSRDESVLQLFSDRADPEAVNALLARANEKAGTEALYIMDRTGKTLCASNWREPSSFVGHQYGYRPYFKDAMAGKEGGFYAIGATTGMPGYFMSHPVYDGFGETVDHITGVVVVKVGLEQLQKDWMDGGETVFVTDANGVIFLSSHQAWKYKSLVPLTPGTLTKIRQGRQYKGISLTALPLKKGRSGRHRWLVINDEKFIWADRHLSAFDWRLHYLIPWQRLEERVNAYLYISAAAGILLILGILFFQERRLKKQSQQQAAEAEKISRINRMLSTEVEERRRTEAHLRQTQEELVQSAKLAALGQMAAAIVHELNQPIAAIRTYAASCRLMADRDKKEDLRNTLFAISDITDRMEAITRQLKNFSRKSSLTVSPVDIREPVRKAASLLRHALSDADCVLTVRAPEEPLIVMGDSLRLEQVFVNLMRNSLDAMVERTEKQIRVDFLKHGDQVAVKISDTGPGIPQDLAGRIFQPFFTTREKGEGLGLGLSISQGIVKEMSGDISVDAGAGPGAVFTVRLNRG